MSDLFAGQTDLGSFSSTPTKQSLLYRCKSIVSTFHNENDSWYTISNLTSTSCTLSATDRNPFYNSSVNFDFVIGTLTPLTSAITNTISSQTYINITAQTSPRSYLLNQFMLQNPGLSINQLNIDKMDFSSSSSQKANTGTIIFSAKTGSMYSGSVTKTFSLTFPTFNISNFAYTGATQTFTAPQDGYYVLEAWGAGSSGRNGWTTKGGYVSTNYYLKQNQKIYVYVGAFGEHTSGLYNAAPNTGGSTGAGGGATDFRLVPNNNTTYTNGWSDPISLNSRIMVAGGGGGNGWSTGAAAGQGGDAGGIISFPSTSNPSVPATQTSGGTPTNPEINHWGSFGVGGYGDGGYGTSGPGGYYGGMGASFRNYRIGSAGGSSFVSGMNGCISIANPLTDIAANRTPKTTGNISTLVLPDVEGQSREWIPEGFIMIDGKNTTVQPNNTTLIGNSTPYARISWIN